MIVDYIELLKMVKEGKIKEGEKVNRLFSNYNFAEEYIFYNNGFYLKGHGNEKEKRLEVINNYSELFNSNFKIEIVAETDYHSEFKEIIKILKEMKDKIK